MAQKKMKGVRANKPNDSFGTINNDSLYKNKYREEVDKDDIQENDKQRDGPTYPFPLPSESDFRSSQ